MTFMEFDEIDQSADPKLVETLCFHAVNGKRCKSSIDFLNSREDQWALVLLSVSLEPNRILTWYWLSCLGKSLKFQERPPLHSLLDPRSSIVVEALQYLSSLLLNEVGSGRLSLLWGHSSCDSYWEFCQSEASKCRKLRRVLMLEAAWIFRRHYMYINGDSFAITMCGDDNAHAATLQNFCDFWDCKHHCCVPPGICRDLKQMALTSSDLTCGHAKSMLYWIAAMTQCSIADVEAMHSQNRALGGNAFSSIAAKFINSEAQRTRDEAMKLQRPDEHQNVKKHCKFRHKRAGVTVDDSSAGTANPKSSSALELFRNHFLRTKRATGEVVNPCNKEFWSEVKTAFAHLTPEQRRPFESLSEESKARVANARLEKKLASKQGSSVTDRAANASQRNTASSSEIIQHPDGFGHGLHAQVLPMHQLVEMLPATDLETLRAAVNKKALGEDTATGVGKNDYPINEATLECVWRAQQAKGCCGKDFYKGFIADSECIARPGENDSEFPAKVLRESWCGEQCRHFGDRERISLHCNTLQLCTEIVKMNLRPYLILV